MGRRRQHLPALIVVGTLLAIASCRSGGGIPTTTQPSSPNGPQLQMQGMTVQNWSTDGLDWEMRSPLGEGFTTRNYLQVSSMSVQLYERGQRSTNISANHAIMATAGDAVEAAPGVMLSSGDMFLNGNVIVVSTDGSRMQTDWVRYSSRDRIIRSSAPVTVERDDSITTGKGLEATADLSQVRIFNQKLIIREKPRR